MTVRCIDCQRFTPNEHSPATGIGRCKYAAESRGAYTGRPYPAYANAPRICGRYQPGKGAPAST